ncbi:MAG: hypothetical protein ACWA42_06060 [Lutibacter sp.]
MTKKFPLKFVRKKIASIIKKDLKQNNASENYIEMVKNFEKKIKDF